MKKKHIDEDIIFEEDVESLSPDFEKKLKKLKKELQKCQKEKEEYLDGWQRAKADFVNFKKRKEEDKKSFAKYANEDLILSLLPTLDNFEAALKDHGPTSPKASKDENAVLKYKVGFEHIYNSLLKTFENLGVEQINPEGETFDHNLHESVEQVKTDNKKEDHKVVEVVMKGYKLGDKILRAAQVKVYSLQE
jgi:molecular chaperone GrpE